jgi:hypothetical protein
MATTWVACSGGEQPLPHGNTDQTGPLVNPDAAVKPLLEAGQATGTCTPKETNDCVIDRGTFMGIHDCALGTQTCGDDGFWGDCIEL